MEEACRAIAQSDNRGCLLVGVLRIRGERFLGSGGPDITRGAFNFPTSCPMARHSMGLKGSRLLLDIHDRYYETFNFDAHTVLDACRT